MKAYINHLLEDIAKAQRSEDIPATFGVQQPQTIEDEFAEIERWLEYEPEHTFSHYCGLEKEQFPPAGQLTEEQLLQINKSFRHLLFTYNLDVSLPDDIPPGMEYTLLVSVLDRKTDIVSSGFMTFEFCNYDSQSCPLNNIAPAGSLKMMPMTT
jgi:hypothetical protein